MRSAHVGCQDEATELGNEPASAEGPLVNVCRNAGSVTTLPMICAGALVYGITVTLRALDPVFPFQFSVGRSTRSTITTSIVPLVGSSFRPNCSCRAAGSDGASGSMGGAFGPGGGSNWS